MREMSLLEKLHYTCKDGRVCRDLGRMTQNCPSSLLNMSVRNNLVSEDNIYSNILGGYRGEYAFISYCLAIMYIENKKGFKIHISDTESETDIQYQLVKKLEDIWIKCSQNCSVSISRVKEENKLDYWKEEKIKKQTSKKMYLDILAIWKWKILIIEMKKKSVHSKKERWYIWAQIDKYKEIWFPVKLCSGKKDFQEIISYF